MNISQSPSLSLRLRFRLASTLTRLAVCVIPWEFSRRFLEETDELLEPKIYLQWEDDHIPSSFSGGTWTQDGTQRIS